MVALSRVKERIETDLSDDEIQSMVDEIQDEIDARFGEATPKGYEANPVTFDGENDFIMLTSNDRFIGSMSGKKGILSCWVKINGSIGSLMVIFRGSEFISSIEIEILSNGKLSIRGASTSGASILDIETVNPFIQSTKWIHILASWDMSVAGSSRLFISDISDLLETVFIDDVLKYAQTGPSMGGLTDAQSVLNGCMADFYWNSFDYLDFNIEANRRKFIDINGKPVNLGVDGSIPASSIPIIYLSGSTDNWHINKGSGGGFNSNEVLTDCIDSPSGVIAKNITIFIGDDLELDGYRTFLDLVRPLSGTAVVTEIDHTTETVVADDDFRVINGGRTLQRLSDGTNPRQFWQRLVKVVYSPVSDVLERDEVIILLVQLGIEYRGLKSVKAGDHASSFMDYATERNALMSRLSPRRGVLMA